MSDPTGLRAMLRAYALATSNAYWGPEEWLDLPEYGTLDAALARVEAVVEAVGEFIDDTDAWANARTFEAVNAALPRRDAAWWRLLETYANLRGPTA